MPWFRRAVSAASACKTPPLFLATALSDMAEVMNDNGEHAVGRVCAQEARKHAENLGSLFRESQALKVEAGCCRSLGHLEHAKDLLTKAQELLLACGVYGSLAHSQVENHLAEVFLLKTEYAEARRLNASSAETAEGRNFGLFARLTIVLIDVHTGGDAVSIRTEIERCWALFKGAGGLWIGKMMCDAVLADLHLREGHVREAKANLLGTYFVASRGNCAMIEIFCLERLADIRVALDEVESTMQWAVIFLACAMNKGNRLAGTQALRCLGAIFSVQQDYDTALSLFEVARAGFVCMGVHRSQADCLRGMAEVYENRREFAKARDLWVEARPLYERCLQTKEVKRIDEKVWDIHSALIAPSRRTIVNSQIS
ncbi:hypothetical protein FB451DRAFT_1247955 [Mycena latifolia]|nr:hypothetical protein FB451DRAFT_1247955 [Mycena latifolia]